MNRTLLIIILAAIVLRLFFSIGINRALLGVTPENETTDGYDRIAENLDAGYGYRQFLTQPPTTERPPGYVFFLYGFIKLFGTRYLPVQIAQALLGGLGCWILFLLGRWVLSDRLGLAAAGLFAVYPNAIQYSARLYTESLYFVLFLAMAYFLCRAAMEGSRWRGLLAGLFWGLGILTRGTLLAMPLMIPFGIAISRRHRSPARRWLAWIVPALIGGVLVVTPWTLRNYNLTGSFVPVSTWGWAPFYHGIQCSKGMMKGENLRRIDLEAFEERYEIVVDRLYGGDKTDAFAAAREFVRHEQVARDLVLEELRHDPGGAAGRAMVGLLFTWFLTLGPRMRLLSMAIHLPLLILFAVGLHRMARRHPDAFVRAWPALGMILFVNLFQAIVFPFVRYMSPAIALSFLFSGLPLVHFFESTVRKASD